ncbi:MAG: phosphoribosyltransferase family protein [Gemmatimonadaceae bacterium]
MRGPLLRDRAYAGRLLAQVLAPLAHKPSLLVLALPRGGVPVGVEIARALRAPLDVFIVRKLGVPGHEEFAMGAIAPGGVRLLNPEVIDALDIAPETVEAVTQREQRELERRARLYGGQQPREIRGATVILVDDGIATGASMQAAVTAVRNLGAAEVIVAAPVMSMEAYRLFASLADRCHCLVAPQPFGSVGEHYVDFQQLSDEDVRRMMASGRRSAGPPARAEQMRIEQIRIRAGSADLWGDLTVPGDAKGIVVFAHGSGSSRHSPRNKQVAAALNQRGFATLLLDLLTEAEEVKDRITGAWRFNTALLGERLAQATDWLRTRADLEDLPIGYFGASTGAAAALIAAATHPADVRAVVSRGGRPDLAAESLARVRAPTLLIVGGNDPQVMALNRAAMRYMAGAEADLVDVPGATHLFEEPGALEEVSRLAAEWFEDHLVHAPVGAR